MESWTLSLSLSLSCIVGDQQGIACLEPGPDSLLLPHHEACCGGPHVSTSYPGGVKETQLQVLPDGQAFLT